METLYKDVEWKDWQLSILGTLEQEEPDHRVINWYVDKIGNKGKSFLATYIVANFKGVVICDGKKENIFNQVNAMMENDEIPRIIILDVPRQMEDKIHYGSLEALKNGCLYSGKYEGGTCLFPPPHVFAFANWKPDETAMSKDRWNITTLK